MGALYADAPHASSTDTFAPVHGCLLGSTYRLEEARIVSYFLMPWVFAGLAEADRHPDGADGFR